MIPHAAADALQQVCRSHCRAAPFAFKPIVLTSAPQRSLQSRRLVRCYGIVPSVPEYERLLCKIDRTAPDLSVGHRVRAHEELYALVPVAGKHRWRRRELVDELENQLKEPFELWKQAKYLRASVRYVSLINMRETGLREVMYWDVVALEEDKRFLQRPNASRTARQKTQKELTKNEKMLVHLKDDVELLHKSVERFREALVDAPAGFVASWRAHAEAETRAVEAVLSAHNDFLTVQHDVLLALGEPKAKVHLDWDAAPQDSVQAMRDAFDARRAALNVFKAQRSRMCKLWVLEVSALTEECKHPAQPVVKTAYGTRPMVDRWEGWAPNFPLARDYAAPPPHAHGKGKKKKNRKKKK